MAYSLMYSHTDLPTVTSEQSQLSFSKCLTNSKALNSSYKCSSEITLMMPSTSEDKTYSSCPESFLSNNSFSDFDALECPGDLCFRCQDGAVTINNRCVCLCQTEECPHKNVQFKHYFPFDEWCSSSLEHHGYRLLENMYSSTTVNGGTLNDDGDFRNSYEGTSSSEDDGTSSTSSSSSSTFSSNTSSSSSSSTSDSDTIVNKTDLKPAYS